MTIAFNHFGEKLVQRMPRCRRGYIHIVNNDFTEWEMYAIGGSANPTINSQGNRYTAPFNPNAKEVNLMLSEHMSKKNHPVTFEGSLSAMWDLCAGSVPAIIN